jgi:hypothetical protein
MPGLSGSRARPPGAPSCSGGVGRPKSARLLMTTDSSRSSTATGGGFIASARGCPVLTSTSDIHGAERQHSQAIWRLGGNVGLLWPLPFFEPAFQKASKKREYGARGRYVCSHGSSPSPIPTTPTTRFRPGPCTPTCAGATPTPAIATSWPPSARNAPASSARKASAGAEALAYGRNLAKPMRSEP